MDVSNGNPTCPPVLPSKHWVLELIIQHFHATEGHAGTRHVLSAIRKQFWIIKAASTIKRVISRCSVCRRVGARPCEQQMSPLPSYRITLGKIAFESTGVDYFGPILVKRGRSLVKRWGCLFTCMRIRAVHLELVYNLTADSFRMALMRFINRRGAPREIFSDNGSNFIGLSRELKEMVGGLPGDSLSNELVGRGIQCNIQPPNVSHRGGVWERLIRSTRRILQAISTHQPMCDETLHTLFTEVERILNNRPLVPCYDDNKDPPTLSPNNLLLLGPVIDNTTD